MTSTGPLWKGLAGMLALGMLLSPAGGQGRAAAAVSDCRTREVRLSLAGEQISFCSPTDTLTNVVEDNLSDPKVGYAQLNQLEGYGVANIRAASAGVAPGPGQPVYLGGSAASYQQSVRESESKLADRTVTDGPSASFWGDKAVSIQMDMTITTSTDEFPLRVIEWYVIHHDRLWIFSLAWDTTMVNAGGWEKTSKHFKVVDSSGLKLPDSALEMGKGPRPSGMGLDVIHPAGGPIDVDLPAWWGGSICDETNYFAHTSPHTHSTVLNTWHGVYACGPVGGPDYGVYFFPGDHTGALEFECVELVLRFFYLEWQIPPWNGNGNSLKDHYDPSKVDFYPNDGTHRLAPGDAITENGDGTHPNTVGHTLLVIDVSGLDTSGNGKIWIMEQNSIPTGIRQMNVHNWIVDPDAWTYGKTIQGWLHAKANQPAGDADPGFGLTGSGLNGPVTAAGLQSTGKIIAAGEFTGYDATPRNHIVRLNPDGTLDATFDPAEGVSVTAGTPQVFALKVLADDTILVGGEFDRYGTTDLANLARLTSSGGIDTGFTPPEPMTAPSGTASIRAIAVQGDGKVLIGGNFHDLGGGSNDFIGRLETNGTIDTTFTANTDGIVYSLAVQPDGKILVGGTFSQVNGVARGGIARLAANGSLDASFAPTGIGPVGKAVNSIALQEDKIYIAGDFATVNGTARNGIARLTSNGSVDTLFDPGTGIGGTAPYLSSVVPQPDGRLLIGGSFSTYYDGSTVNNFTRLSNDGKRDSSFISRFEVDNAVQALTMQPDYKILLGGAFSGYIARLMNEIAPCYSMTVSSNPAAGGTVTVNSPTNCPGEKFISGSSVQLTAAPNTAQEYIFTHWSGDVSGISNPNSNPAKVMMTATKSITGNFLDPPHSFSKVLPTNETIDLPSSVTLSWQASPGATSYHYCLSAGAPGPCNSGTGPWISTGFSTSAAVSNLLPSTPYYWNVRAYNQAGDTTGGATWSFTRNAIPALPGPVSPSGIIHETQPLYRWNESAGVTTYHLVVEKADGSATFVDQDVSSPACAAGACSYLPAGVILELGNYHFKVRAFTAEGDSGYSDWMDFQVTISTYLPFVRK